MRIATWATALYIAAYALPLSARADAPRCEATLPTAVGNFVRASFPDRDVSFSLAAYNDVLCEEEEDMANVVVTVSTPDYPPQYGIFHLHYARDGSVPRIPASFFETMWMPLETSDSWRAPWCELMRSVYPKELERQHCF